MFHDSPYNEGYRAYERYGAPSENPYDPEKEPFDCQDWDEGWCDAYDAANQEISDD